jgi:A/G-specific adenine glycosylase
VIADAEGKVLLARRAEGGLFGGLWEPPMAEAASIRSARAKLGALGVELAGVKLREAGRVKHVLSHRQMDVEVATGEVAGKGKAPGAMGAPYEKAAWMDPSAASVGISTLARKVLAAAKD